MDCTTSVKRSYSILTHQDREEIMIGLRVGESIRSIAARLGRQPSVISREIKTNRTESGRYQAYWTNSRSVNRRRDCRKREQIGDPVIREYIPYEYVASVALTG